MSLLEQKIHAADLMLQLECELRTHGLWESDLPTLEQMGSSEPFACDVMPLQQWLQWVFLPRMKAVVESNADLPHACNISSYAQETIAKLEVDTTSIVAILRELDLALSA